MLLCHLFLDLLRDNNITKLIILLFSLSFDSEFDPWNECSKGLADLLQEEEKTTEPDSAQHISTASHTHSFLSAFPTDVSFK